MLAPVRDPTVAFSLWRRDGTEIGNELCMPSVLSKEMIRLRQKRVAWLATLALVLVIVTSAARAVVVASQPASPPADVVVSTDAANYAPGDAVSVTLVNGTTTSIAPLGGIVCQGSPWPFAVERLDDAGMWQAVDYPRTPPCIGIAVALLGPGQTQTKTVAASADPGEYRLVYAFRAMDGSEGTAASDPFLVAPP
jgi:hypothetical protein